MAADPLQSEKGAATQALVDDARCVPLAHGFSTVVVQEALAVIAGTSEVPLA